MSDATPEEDKARELERMYDFFHAPDVTDDVVARAIKELNGSLEVVNNLLEIETYKYEADSYQAKWQWHLKQLILTHLAELEEHKQIAHYRENGVSGCAVCDVDYEYCDFVVTKAKRLLGEEL